MGRLRKEDAIENCILKAKRSYAAAITPDTIEGIRKEISAEVVRESAESHRNMITDKPGGVVSLGSQTCH